MILTELYVFESAPLIGLILTWPRQHLLYNPLYYIREYGVFFFFFKKILLALGTQYLFLDFDLYTHLYKLFSQFQCLAVSVYLNLSLKVEHCQL